MENQMSFIFTHKRLLYNKSIVPSSKQSPQFKIIKLAMPEHLFIFF